MSHDSVTVRIAVLGWVLIAGLTGCNDFASKRGGPSGPGGSGADAGPSDAGPAGSDASSASGNRDAGGAGSNHQDAAGGQPLDVGAPGEGSGDTPGAKAPESGEIGSACASDRECGSGQCVDGVCCESRCSGTCEACAEANAKGRCVAVTGKPRQGHASCTGDADGACAGTCDGVNRSVCTYPGASQSCRQASCAANVATLSAGCDGKGICPAPQTVACAPQSCAGTICAGGCSDTQPCTGANYCSAGKCAGKKANGQTCQGASECTSGFCADGICCNNACGGACMACNVTGAAGTCSPVKSGLDEACNGAQACDAQGACKKSNGQACTTAADCSSGTCVDGRCCSVSSCGTCQACTGGGGTCAAVTGAEDPDSCSSTKSCDVTGACKLKAGQSCTAANQCGSGFCADGVCCNSSCSGTCEACAEASSKGTCVAVSGAPRSGHAACAGAGTTCGGSCDGTNRTACSYPTSSCRAASCTNGTATVAASCDGRGACPAMQTVNCAPNTCAGAACAGGCSSSQACAGTHYCNAGVCTPKKGNGSVCGSAAECTSGSCTDGVCCSSSCGECESCTGANGTCVDVKNADDPNSCTGANTCDGSGACKKKQGQPCTSAAQCITGYCTDGVCCNQACTDSCQYCGGNGSNAPAGTCGNVSGAPRSGHPACSGTGACQGTCGGSSAKCTMPGTATMCRGLACSADSTKVLATAYCDGTGNCPTGATMANCLPDHSCNGGACLCNGETLPSGTCGTWTFEKQNDIGNWTRTRVPANGTLEVLWTSNGRNGSAGALYVVPRGQRAWAGVNLGSTKGDGYKASAWVYLNSGVAKAPTVSIALTGESPGMFSGTRIEVNKWVQIEANLTGTNEWLIVQITDEVDMGGNLYIDDVKITRQ